MFHGKIITTTVPFKYLFTDHFFNKLGAQWNSRNVITKAKQRFWAIRYTFIMYIHMKQ